MLSLLLLTLTLNVSAKAVFAFAVPASSSEVNTTPKIENKPHLNPRQWDSSPTEPYTLPMVPAVTAADFPSWTASSADTSAPTSKPSYTYAETHNDDKNTHTHEIIAGVIGGLFIGVPILGTIIFCLCRRCWGTKEDEEMDEKAGEAEGRQSLVSSRYSVESGERENIADRGHRYPEVRYWV